MSGEPDVGPDGLDVTPIGDAVSSLLRSRGMTPAKQLAEVIAAWEQAVGPELAVRVRPVALRGDELVVEVDSSPWATQVSLLSDRLLEGLSACVGHPVARRLSPRVNPRSKR